MEDQRRKKERQDRKRGTEEEREELIHNSSTSIDSISTFLILIHTHGSFIHPLSSNLIHFHPISSTSIQSHPLPIQSHCYSFPNLLLTTCIHTHPYSSTFIHTHPSHRILVLLPAASSSASPSGSRLRIPTALRIAPGSWTRS